MPIYEYKCAECGESKEILSNTYTLSSDLQFDCKCGAIMKRIISKSQGRPVIIEEYSESADAHFTGPAQKARILKEKGLEPVSPGTKISHNNHHGSF